MSRVQSTARHDEWGSYYAGSARSPAHTLVFALQRFGATQTDGYRSPGERLRAVDLGAGVGDDTRLLLARGWHVLALDGSTVAVDELRRLGRAMTRAGGHLEVGHVRFEDIARLPPVELINASLALPFCPANSFFELWNAITDALVPNGRFSGHFFGDRDQWTDDGRGTFFTEAEVRDLFAGLFEIEMWHEIERDGPDARGRHKHWHVFEIVARRHQHR